MQIPISTQSSVPISNQIASWFATAIARGDFDPGDTLPSIKQVALDNRVSPHFVRSAYEQLQADGVLTVQNEDFIVARLSS